MNVDNDSHICSVKTDTTSSIHLGKKVINRSYSSQFTLNDQIMVGVSRSENYLSNENAVIVEVDICLGIYDLGRPIDERYLVRLCDMASSDRWVFRMTNYDDFVDTDILTSLKKDAMEPNKQYRLLHKPEDRSSGADSYSNKKPISRNLRTTQSQFNSPGDNKLEKNIKADNDDNKISVFTEIYDEKPDDSYIDIIYTSYIDVDLTKDEPIKIPACQDQKHFPCSDLFNPIIKDQINPEIEVVKSQKYEVDGSADLVFLTDNSPDYFPEVDIVNESPSDTESENTYLIIKDSPESIPDTTCCTLPENKGKNDIDDIIQKDESLVKIQNKEQPDDITGEKNGEFSNSIPTFDIVDLSDAFNECNDSNKPGVNHLFEVQEIAHDGDVNELPYESTMDNFNEVLSPDNRSALSIDIGLDNRIDFIDTVLEPNLHFKKDYEDFTDLDDFSYMKEYEDFTDGLYIKEDGSQKPNDILCQENLVLQLDTKLSIDRFNPDNSPFGKEYVYTPKDDEFGPTLKILSSDLNSEEEYVFVPVLVRRMYYESLSRKNSNSGLSTNTKPLRLITSDNYTEMVDMDRLSDDVVQINANEENEFVSMLKQPLRSPSQSTEDASDEEQQQLEFERLEECAKFKNHEPEMTNLPPETADNDLKKLSIKELEILPNVKSPIPALRFQHCKSDNVENSEFPATNKDIIKDEIKSSIESSSQKFDNFLREREKNQPWEPLDNDSLFSLKRQKSENQNILRQGDSIEDIEQMLLQQQPEFASRKDSTKRIHDSDYHNILNNEEDSRSTNSSTPTPDISSERDFPNIKNQSIDRLEKHRGTKKVHTIQGQRKRKPSTDDISSDTSTLSCTSDKEYIYIKGTSLEQRERFKNSDDHMSSSSDTISGESDQECSGKQSFEDRYSKEVITVQCQDDEKTQLSRHSSTGSVTTSSFYDETTVNNSKTIDHLEEYEKAKGHKSIKNKRENVNKNDNFSDNDTWSILSNKGQQCSGNKPDEIRNQMESNSIFDEDHNNRGDEIFDVSKFRTWDEVSSLDKSIENRDNDKSLESGNMVPIQSKEMTEKDKMKDKIPRCSSDSSDTISTSSDGEKSEKHEGEQRSLDQSKPGDNKEVIYRKSSTDSYSQSSSLEGERSKDSSTDSIQDQRVEISDKRQLLKDSSTSSYTSSSTSEKENIDNPKAINTEVDLKRFSNSSTLSSSSENELEDSKGASIDCFGKTVNFIKPNILPDKKDRSLLSEHSSTSEVTLPSSSDEESRRKKSNLERSKDINTTPYERLKSTSSYSISSDSDNESERGTNQSVDRLEEIEMLKVSNTIECKSKPNNDEKSLSEYAVSNKDSYKSSNHSGKMNEKENIVPVLDGLESNVREKKDSISGSLSSDLSIGSTSAYYVIINKEEDEMKNTNDRRYLTLPIKRDDNNLIFKEKCKSLDAPMTLIGNSFPDLMNSDSNVDVTEKRYSEYTETWSRQSPIDDKYFNRAPVAKLEKRFTKNSSGIPSKRGIQSIATTPRPFPSYLSPINSFPYVDSDQEFGGSDDSIFSNYKSDDNAMEIDTSDKSLPDFIKNLSRSNLPKARLPIRLVTPRPKSECPLMPVDLNYGAGDDSVDFPSNRIIRRVSSNSVTTDSSYLDKPVLSEKLSISNLARLDSLSSYSEHSNVVESIKGNQQQSKPLSESGGSSYSLATSASSIKSDTEPETEQKETPSIEFQKSSIQNNELKSLHDNQTYSTKYDNINLQNRVSTSESSLSLSTSSEEDLQSK